MEKDISGITQIPLSDIRKLSELCEIYIGNCIRQKTNETVTIDIGIGYLCVLGTGDSVTYKFIPSESLKEAVVSGCDLTKRLEEVAKKVTLDAYENAVW